MSLSFGGENEVTLGVETIAHRSTVPPVMTLGYTCHLVSVGKMKSL